mgnify:CR=1 FL=1
MNVSVRDGLVLINPIDLEKQEIQKDNQYTQSSDGKIQLKAINAFDENWLWTQKIVANFDIQGKSMLEYLDWVSIETGYALNYKNYNIQKRAKTVMLSGSINGIMPIDSLDVIFPSTKFSYEINNNEIYIDDTSL